MFLPNPANQLMSKHHLSNYWRWEKIPFFFPIPIPPLVVRRVFHYTCNIIRDAKLWFSKCGWKVNLFCDNQVKITYSLKNRIRKFTFLRYSFFWKRTDTLNLMKISSKTIFTWYTFGKFYIAKFSYFSGRPNKVKEILWNIFDWPLCLWYWKYRW